MNENVKFTFFDNRTYEYFKGFRRQLGQARKYEGNPMIVPELQHEFKRLHYYGTALYHERDQRFKTWYSNHYYGEMVQRPRWNGRVNRISPRSNDRSSV